MNRRNFIGTSDLQSLFTDLQASTPQPLSITDQGISVMDSPSSFLIIRLFGDGSFEQVPTVRRSNGVWRKVPLRSGPDGELV